MKVSRFLWILGITATVPGSCKKHSQSEAVICGYDAAMVRTVNNQEAKVVQEGSVFFIIEKNTIDTKLRPCNLPEEFKINQLLVVVSGVVKSTVQSGACCVDDFAIINISK